MTRGEGDSNRSTAGSNRRRGQHAAKPEQVDAARRQLPEDDTATRPTESSAVDGTQHLDRAEERLVPRVDRVQPGEVVLNKRVVEDPQTISVALAHDRVDLERRTADRPLQPGEEPISTRGEETVLLIVEERIEVRKIPWVVEEIHLRRQVVREEREISDTVRKTRVEIETRGDVELREGGG